MSPAPRATDEACAFDTSCNAVCRTVAICAKTCADDEVCKVTTGSGSGVNGECKEAPTFDAGTLAFSGTTKPLALRVRRQLGRSRLTARALRQIAGRSTEA